MSKLTGGKMLAQLNRKNPNLGALISKLIAAHNHVAAQIGVDPVGQAAAPPPPQSVQVIVTGEQANIRVVDNNPTNRARTYFSEVHTDAQFSSPKMVVQHGATRDAQVLLPTFDAAGAMQAYHIRTYSQTAGSPPSPTVAYPTYVTMAGTTSGDLPASAGSGTSPATGTVSAQGYGEFPTRNATKSNTAVYTGGGGGGGVGGVTQIVAGSNVTISPAGGTGIVTVNSATGGMTNPMTTVGDLIVGGAVSGGVAAPTRLAAGTSGYVLTSGGPGVAPSYQPGGGGGGGFTPYTIAPSPAPLSSTLTWVNQGVATASDVNGLTVQTPGTTSQNINALVKPLPATPYTFTIGIFFAAPAANVGLAGIAVLDNSGKIVFYGIAAQSFGYELAFQEYTATTFAGTYATASLGGAGVPFIFLRLADDGTNFTVSYSYDGLHFNQVGTPQSRTGYLSPSQIGLCVDDSANVSLSMTVAYWAGI